MMNVNGWLINEEEVVVIQTQGEYQFVLCNDGYIDIQHITDNPFDGTTHSIMIPTQFN